MKVKILPNSSIHNACTCSSKHTVIALLAKRKACTSFTLLIIFLKTGISFSTAKQSYITTLYSVQYVLTHVVVETVGTFQVSVKNSLPSRVQVATSLKLESFKIKTLPMKSQLILMFLGQCFGYVLKVLYRLLEKVVLTFCISCTTCISGPTFLMHLG